MKNLKKYHYPKNLKHALRLLSTSKSVRPIGLGSSLSLSKDPNITELVDITDIGLNFITAGRGNLPVQIGSASAAQDIIEAAGAHRDAPLQGLIGKLLKLSAKAVGSQQIRNSVTVGGNICGLMPWSDFPVVLLALDAKIYLKSAKKERALDAASFFEKHPVNILKKGELCVKIEFPKPAKNYRGEFIKIGRTAVDKTIMNACVVFALKNNKITDLRIAVSGCISLPKRLTNLENTLNGLPADENISKTILKEAVTAKEKLNFISDLKATSKYRKDIFEVVILDAFEKAIKEEPQRAQS